MPDISAIQNTPDVSFIDNKTIDDVRGDMVADFEAFMLQATGNKVSLGRSLCPPHDPVFGGGADLPSHAVR